MEDKFIELLRSKLCKQVNVALLYAELMRQDRGDIDWIKIDQAIVAKWSGSGIKKVRVMAWQLIEGDHLKLSPGDNNENG